VSVEFFLAEGDPAVEISRFAADHDDDAIVLVRRSQLQPGRGGILRGVLAQTPLPIIFVVTEHRNLG
jgi:nucleotide-binding universal stress UspA family protein